MPSCYCQWAKCNGKAVSKRLFEDHQRQDKRVHVNAALQATNRAIEEQDADIAAYIAALTLADETAGSSAGSSAGPGGRLWARDANSSSGSAQSSFPYLQSPVSEALDTIRDVSNRLTPLEAAINLALPQVGKPATPVDVFPLKSHLRDVTLLQGLLTSIATNRASVREVKDPVAESVTALLARLTRADIAWAQELKLLCRTPDEAQSFDTRYYFTPILKGLDPIVQVSIFTMVALQVMMHTSQRGCRFLLAMLRYIIQLTLMRRNSLLVDSDARLLSDFPVDPDSASQRLHLNGQETIQAVCPNSRCHKTYAPTFEGKSRVPIYPLYCTHRQFTSGAQCGTRLTRLRIFANTEVQVPIKRFVSFSFKDFIANLTSRPGFENMMDTYCANRDGIMRDLSDGRFLRRDFKGPDGAPFLSSAQDSRYIFSLCVDFFNPFTNKQAGKKSSVGIIYVVCLSLPPSHRYRPENMFLAGIIPGPNEPPLTTINHYLTPVVNELMEFWDPGVRFTQTFNHPEGRLIYCALILVVCDLLAARKAAGFAACTHEHFCSVCQCTRSQHGYGNTDYASWEFRTDENCRKAANDYLKAATADARLFEFNQTGVRWSELLRLPYFDMSRCVIVDSMHNLFLGLIKEHFKGILGMARESLKEKVIDVSFGLFPDTMSENDIKGVEKLRGWLEEPVILAFPTNELGLKKLGSVNMNSLIFVCRELGCSPTSKSRYYKKDYAAELLAWRQGQDEKSRTGSNTATMHGHVLEEAELTEIRSDIQTILTPSWLGSVPANLGSASHGKLKADQWRTLGTVHLPLSLARLWSLHVNHQWQDPRAVRCHRILLVTMALVSAVILATSRTVAHENAAAYRDYMLAYLEGIKYLFPDYKMRPNHHMAVHLYDYLLLFGPVHSWWTFPFERMIGAVQRMPHNSRIGELEETVARAYTRSSNLRAVIARSGCPEVIKHSENIFRKLVDPQIRDSLGTDIQAFTALLDEDEDVHDNNDSAFPQSFGEELQLALKVSMVKVPSRGRLLHNFRIGGVIYSTFSTHQGNSCILFVKSPNAEPIPARIMYIIQFAANGVVETRLGIRCHKPANLQTDPLSSFLVLRAAMWDAELDNLQIIHADQISTHFACLQVCLNGQLYASVLSLSRNCNDPVAQHAAQSLQHIKQLRQQQLKA